jgi:hypothetical protein
MMVSFLQSHANITWCREQNNVELVAKVCNKKGRMLERVAREKNTSSYDRDARLADAQKCFKVFQSVSTALIEECVNVLVLKDINADCEASVVSCCSLN